MARPIPASTLDEHLDSLEHPGDHLARLIGETGMSRIAFANHIGMSSVVLSHIITRFRRFTPMRALQIARAFPRYSAAFWVTRQAVWDLEVFRAQMPPLPKIKPLYEPYRSVPHHLRPSPDRCLCGDWGWQHTKPDGGCTHCACPMFMRRSATAPPPITQGELEAVWRQRKQEMKEAAANAKARSKKDPG